MSFQKINALMHRGAAFLGTQYAILGGAMTWVSNHQLVAAISNAGGFGVLACGSMTVDLLSQEIQKTQAATTFPFGVNLITMHPDLAALVEVCLSHQVGHVVLAGGLPPSAIIQRLREGGAKVICFAPALVLAKRLIKQGVHALVLEGSEAGGHIGPVSTCVLAQEILPLIKEVPIFMAGGIARGETMATYLQMGAAGCQLGTRFVCAHESPAHPAFKQAFIRAQARDAVPSVQLDERFPVIPVRALTNKASHDFMQFQRRVIDDYHQGMTTLQEGQLAIEHYWAGALRRAVVDGDVDNGSLMAGQCVGLVKQEQTLADIMAELLQQAEDFLSLEAGSNQTEPGGACASSRWAS